MKKAQQVLFVTLSVFIELLGKKKKGDIIIIIIF